MSSDGPAANRFTREELYQMVWSEPMSKLARRLGLSDRGLSQSRRPLSRKACRVRIVLSELVSPP